MPKSFVPTNVGFILNELREKKKLRACDLADGIKLSRENIHAIENIRTNPSLHTFMKMLEFMGYELQVVKVKNNKYHSTLKFIKDEI